MPKDGFVEMYRNIIEYPGIDINLEIDALEHILIDEENKKVKWDNELINIIYTGAIDELFKYKYGVLPYRSLHFRYDSIKKESFPNVGIVAYPQVEGYTRITEYTKMPFQKCNGWTNAVYEYPVKYDKKSMLGNEPYYPVLTDESIKMFEKYKVFAQKFDNLTLCGRLADFKYYNMDQVILRTLQVYDEMGI